MGESDVACEEIWATVQALNRAWAVDGHPERLANYFAPEMIAITPTDRLRLDGQKACIAGWTEFVHTTKILRWLESNPATLVLAAGRAAVVAYDFQIDFGSPWPGWRRSRSRLSDSTFCRRRHR
jgi:hypothetical protein